MRMSSSFEHESSGDLSEDEARKPGKQGKMISLKSKAIKKGSTTTAALPRSKSSDEMIVQMSTSRLPTIPVDQASPL